MVNFILQTMDPGNMAMRRSCLQNSMATLKEVVRVFPMVSLNDSSTRLAVGDAIGDINKSIIRVYEMQRCHIMFYYSLLFDYFVALITFFFILFFFLIFV